MNSLLFFLTRTLWLIIVVPTREKRGEGEKSVRRSEALVVLRKIAENRKHKVVMHKYLPARSNVRDESGNETELLDQLRGFVTTEIIERIAKLNENKFERYSVKDQGYENEARYDALRTGLFFAFLLVLWEPVGTNSKRARPLFVRRMQSNKCV